MISKRRISLRFKLNLYILSAAAIIYVLAIGYISIRLKNKTYDDSVEIVKSYTREYRNMVQADLNEINASTKSLRDIFAYHKNYDEASREKFFNDILKSWIESNPEYLSTWLIWEIKTFDKNYKLRNGRIRISYYRLDGELVYDKEIVDQNNDIMTGLYYELRDLNEESVMDPYYDIVTTDLAGILMTSIVAPVQSETGIFEGLVGVDISLEQMKNSISEIHPFDESISYIIGRNRLIVAHSNEQIIGQDFLANLGKDSVEFRQGFQNTQFNEMYDFRYENDKDGKEYFVSLAPITIGKIDKKWMIGIEVPLNIIMAEANKALGNTIVVGAVGLLLLSVIIYFIARGISNPIIKGVNFAKTISDGNLSERLTINQNDEIGDLTTSLTSMAENLKEIIGEVIQSSDAIAEASIELLKSSQRLSEGSANQAASAEEISTSMEEMVSNIYDNTQNAKETEKIALKAVNGIKEGSELTQTMINSMVGIAEKISIVGEIAKQTNILAINAAVEAARSGEQGKEFAVVAGEVKKLAERSRIAARQIEDLSGHGVEIAKSAGNMLSTIIPDIERTASLVQKIVVASVEQKSSTEQVNQVIQQLNLVTQQNAESASSFSQNSKDISWQAENLKKLIGYFKIR